MRKIEAIEPLTAKDDDSNALLEVPKGKIYPVLYVEDRRQDSGAWLVTIGIKKNNRPDDNWGDWLFPENSIKFINDEDNSLFPGNAGIIYLELKRRGFLPHQIAAILGTLQQESNFSPYAKEQGYPYQGIGLFQWSFDRKKGVPRFTGNTRQDIINQLDYFERELRTSEKKAGDILLGSKTLYRAMDGMKAYERYGTAGNRYVYAKRFAQQLGVI